MDIVKEYEIGFADSRRVMQSLVWDGFCKLVVGGPLGGPQGRGTREEGERSSC